MMAKATGSKPSCTAIGAKIGTVSRMIEIESIRQPSTNHIATITSMTPHCPAPVASRNDLAASVKPVIDSTRE